MKLCRKGFTLIEVSISIILILIIINTAFILLSQAVVINKEIIVQKELIEIGSFFEDTLRSEFSRSERIGSVLSKDNIVYGDIGTEPVDIRCIKLIRSKFTTHSNPYKDELIYLRDDSRKSVWISKNSSKYVDLDVKRFLNYRAYEVATLVNSIKISKISNTIYNIDLELIYPNTDIKQSKSFFVKLQN